MPREEKVIARWKTDNSNWVKLVKYPNGWYSCSGKHSGQSFGPLVDDETAIIQIQSMIDRGRFNAPTPEWLRTR